MFSAYLKTCLRTFFLLLAFLAKDGFAGELHNLATNLINQQRSRHGLSALNQNSKLQIAAQSHAEWMAKTGTMVHAQEHDKPRNYAHHKTCDWIHINRIIKAGYFDYDECFHAKHLPNGIVADSVPGIDDMSGEIIAAGWGAGSMNYAKQLQRHVVPGWMKSPGHKKEIVTANYEELGVGYGVGSKGSFWCVTFGDPIKSKEK